MLPNPQETADLVTLTEEILNGKIHFLCSERYWFKLIDRTTNITDILRPRTRTQTLHYY